jgi:methionyl-tRNA formyltransferase
MRIVFLGTPEFAVPTLAAIAAAGHEIAAVITQPDRPKGRGQESSAPPVKRAAQRLGLRLFQPERIRTPEFLDFFHSLEPEAGVVVGYGRIIPQSLIDVPRLGILNVHASLLPKYRGAAPIQWAIASGETATGVTIMRIDAGLDTGDLLCSAETEIGADETAPELAERLARMGARLLVDELAAPGAAVKQDDSRATLAPVLTKEDGRIDWTRPAAYIHNRIRGFQPWPGGYTRFRGQLLNIGKARPGEALEGAPGSLHRAGNRLLAACGDGRALELLEVQMAGRKRMPAAAFLNGHHVEDNELLEMNA